MANTKIMIVSIIVVAAVVSAGAFVMLGNKGGQSTDDIDALGLVYGNANGDAVIDEKDLQLIQDIMDGKETFDDHPLADTNMDGKVNESDYAIVQQFIDGESISLYVRDTYGGLGYIEYPIKGIFAAGGTNMRVLIQVLDMEKHLVLNATTEDYISPVLDKVLVEARQSGQIEVVTTSASADDWVKVGQHAEEVSLALLEDNAISSYGDDKGRKTFSDLGIDVLQFSADNFDSLRKATATLGILTGAETQAQQFIDMLDGVSEKIHTTLGSKFGTATVMCITMSNSVSGYNSDYYNATEVAGGNNIADWPDKTRNFDPKEDQWLFEEKYNPDYLFHFKSMKYGNEPEADEVKGYASYFDKTYAYMNNCYYLINGVLPLPVRIAFMSETMYPGSFETDWYLTLFQEYVDKFVDNPDLDVTQWKVTWDTEDLSKL